MRAAEFFNVKLERGHAQTRRELGARRPPLDGLRVNVNEPHFGDTVCEIRRTSEKRHNYGAMPITAIPAFTACASCAPLAPLALNAPIT